MHVLQTARVPRGVALLARVSFTALLSALVVGAAAGVLAEDQPAAPDSRPQGQATVGLAQVIPEFVKSHSTPSVIINQLSRWTTPVCPTITGLQPNFGQAISRRIVALAASVGAPTAEGKCDFNVEILFTPKPQAMLADVARKYPGYLGYVPDKPKPDTTFNRAIQVWYVTATHSGNGNTDASKQTESLKSAPLPPMEGSRTAVAAKLPDLMVDSASTAAAINAAGGRGASGKHLTSEIMHVLVIVDPTKVTTQSLGSISDYIAVLTLTRMASLDTCSDLPSIVDLFSVGGAIVAQLSPHRRRHQRTARQGCMADRNGLGAGPAPLLGSRERPSRLLRHRQREHRPRGSDCTPTHREPVILTVSPRTMAAWYSRIRAAIATRTVRA